MNKRTPTAAQARYRMRFSTHAVPDSARKSVSKLNRMWLGQAMAFVAVFSLIFSSVSPTGAIAAEDLSTEAVETQEAVTTDSETALDESLDVTPDADSTEDETSDTEEVSEAPVLAEVEWTSEDGIETTADAVKLGVVYTAPQDSEVTVTFTKLPVTPGKLSVKEVTLSDEEKDSIGAATNVGYEITSDMENGSFEYELTLPAPAADVEIAYSESSEDLEDVKSVESEVSGGLVTATELDHFTFFISILIPKIKAQDLCTHEPSVYRTWELTNNKNTSVNLTWKIQNIPLISPVLQTGTVTIPANSSTTFDTPTVTGFNFMVITGGGLILPVIELNEGDSCDPEYFVCGTELVDNGSFEKPEVSTNAKWNIYPSGSPELGWKATWNGGSTSYNLQTRPAAAQVEILENGVVSNWNAQAGDQYAEMDTDWVGPTGNLEGEPASINLYQYVPTVPGKQYRISFWTAPRPDQNSTQNNIEFTFGAANETISGNGNGSSNVWTEHTYTVMATSAFTKINFTDLSSANSFGMFLDSVSVKQDCSYTICKQDDSGNNLPGWTVFLKGALADTVNVDVNDGQNDYSDVLPAGDYVLEASGSYHYRNDGFADRSDAGFSKRLPGEMGATAMDPWVKVNNFTPGYEGWLGIMVNDNTSGLTNWGNTFNASHEYQSLFTQAVADDIGFKVLDDQYGDNNDNSLEVDIYPIYKGVTGENGCVTIYAPAGSYTVDELMQDGWVNSQAGAIGYQVSLPTNNNGTYTLVNICDEGCESQVTVCKINDETQEGMEGWTVFLKGEEVDSFVVGSSNPMGATSDALELGKQYLATVSGQWQNRGFETVDTKFTTPNSWTTVLDAPQGGYPDDLLELQVNDNFVEWGPYSSAHEYQTVFTGTGVGAKFRVYDFASPSDATANSAAWFGDNVDSNSPLTVTIYEVYSGVTGSDGCVTLEDVPFGKYELGEIQQDGWLNKEGDGTTVIVNEEFEQTEDEKGSNFTLINYCDDEEVCGEPEIPTPNLHLIKVVCEDYSDINGNEAANLWDDTDGNYSMFDNSPNFSLDGILVNGFVDPSEIPDGEESDCYRATGWDFVLTSGQNDDENDTNAMVVTTAGNGEFVTPIDGDDSDLNEALQTGIRNGNFWVQENVRDGYGFGALRCYNDAYNGDNLEYINIGDANPTDIYCIAYNVELEEMCYDVPISNVESGADTRFLGGATVTAPLVPWNPIYYPEGTPAPVAVGVGPTGFPNAWDGSLLSPDVLGADYVSDNATQPTNPGSGLLNGNQNAWRLFEHQFTIPAGAVAISVPTLHFGGDNSVDVYLDNSFLASKAHPGFTDTTDVALPTLAPGTHTLKFVVKNDQYDGANNPTGLIYKLDAITFDCASQEPESRTVSGLVYYDENNNGNQEDGEDPIEGMTVKLIRAEEDGADEGSDLDETLVATDVTDASGNYSFVATKGCYIVRELPAGYVITEPSPINEYFINVMDAECNFNEVMGFLFKTANAADASTVFDPYVGQSLDFGNFDNGSGGSNSGGGSQGSRPVDRNGSVLGDSTTIPSDTPLQPQVAGATTLPVTGSPTWVLLLIALMAAPLYYFRTLAVKKA